MTGVMGISGYAPIVSIIPTPTLPAEYAISRSAYDGTLELPHILIPPSGVVRIAFDGSRLTDQYLAWFMRIDYSGPSLEPFPILLGFRSGATVNGSPRSWYGWHNHPLPPGSTLYVSIDVAPNSAPLRTIVTVTEVLADG